MRFHILRLLRFGCSIVLCLLLILLALHVSLDDTNMRTLQETLAQQQQSLRGEEVDVESPPLPPGPPNSALSPPSPPGVLSNAPEVGHNGIVPVKYGSLPYLKLPEVQRIWPLQSGETEDRILNQMNLAPTWAAHSKEKVIMVRGMEGGSFHDCPVQNCRIVMDQHNETADVIVFNFDVPLKYKRQSLDQIWVLSNLECPYHTMKYGHVQDQFNWTATYRGDSTLTTPYEKFVFYKNFTSLPREAKRNYAEGKTKMAAWFVTNCGHGRQVYVTELQEYVDVDIYGKCGDFVCPRDRQDECNEKLNKDYKFYISFENTNCKNYITEKFFVVGLQNDVVPIVYGAHPDDYRQVAPPHSYIHVDDFEGPRQLADYLLYLDANHTAYNEYFRWKGSGEFINTKFWCRLCAMAHVAERAPRTWYSDVQTWWRGKGTCLPREKPDTWNTWRGITRETAFEAEGMINYENRQ